MSTQLDTLVSEAIRNALNSDSIKERVQKAADKAVDEAIESAFSYSSQFRKQLKANIEQVIPLTNVNDVAVFAHAVRELLQRRLQNLANETAEKHLAEVFEMCIPDDPIITMEDFKKAYIKKLKEEASRESHCECEEIEDDEIEYTWEHEQDKHTLFERYSHLYFGPKSCLGQYDRETSSLSLKKSDADPTLLECYYYRHDGKETKLMFAGPLHGFDALVFRLATGLAKLKA